MSGTEMLLSSMFKAFLKPDQAKLITAKLEGMINDGTFDRIGAIPTDLVQIKQALAHIIREQRALRELVEQLSREVANRSDQPQAANAIPLIANGSGLVAAASSEHGANGD